MARAIVTQETVAAAAQQLLDAGEELTIVTVQAKIGGGSFSTVKRHLDDWKAQRKAGGAPPAAPDAVIQRATELARLVWQEASALAAQETMQARAEADRQVEQARAAEAEAERAVSQLESEAEIRAAEAEARAAELEATRQERDTARAALVQAQLAAQVAEARFAEQAQYLTDLQRQVEAQSRELAEARAEILAQARIVGEVEALRRQLGSTSRSNE